MERAEYRAFRDAEADHWWFRARQEILLDRIRKLPLEGRVLDAGCGAGPFLEALGPSAVGMDDSPDALAICRARGMRLLVRGRITRLPFRAGTFGGILLLDVLEHVRDDAAALRDGRRALAPGGWAVISVPAHRLFFGPHDRAVHHHRRYGRHELVSLVTRVFGAAPDAEGYFFALTFGPMAVWRIVEKVFGSRRAKVSNVRRRLPRAFNDLLERLMGLERALLRRSLLPIGTSLLAVASKRSE